MSHVALCYQLRGPNNAYRAPYICIRHYLEFDFSFFESYHMLCLMVAFHSPKKCLFLFPQIVKRLQSIFVLFQKAMNTIQEMKRVGVKPNVKTYTTLIHGWARASLPEKALKCFEEMKKSGLKPDKAVYHCLMTSLLSRATVAEDYIITGIHRVCEEMVESGLTVDMGTAVHWSRCLRKIERTGGDITEALQKTFPPDWNSHRNLNAASYDTRNNEGLNDSDHDDGPLYEVNSDSDDDTNTPAM